MRDLFKEFCFTLDGDPDRPNYEMTDDKLPVSTPVTPKQPGA